MFATADGTVDRALERRREARRCELRAIGEQKARLEQRTTQIVRAADDEGDWHAAGCRSSAAWLAQVSSSDYRTAARITETSAALPALPELDRALATGAMSLDQVAAAAEFATPASDAELARVAVGKAPGEVGRVARTITPPRVADDEALYRRRSLSTTWTRGRRELAISGRLPLELGVVFEQAIWDIAKAQRAADKKRGVVLGEWQQSTADALVTFAQHESKAGGGVRRSGATLIVHVSDDEPPLLEGAGPISRESASYAQKRALYKRSKHCQYPGCTAARELDAHHLVADEDGGETVLDNLILLCLRHHKRLHDQHVRTSGRGEAPVFTDVGGRVITAARPHAPPG